MSLCPPKPLSFRCSGDLARHQLAQTAQRAELQRADRAFVLAEHVRDLTARHVLDETEHEHFLLLDRQVLHRAAQRVDFLTTDRMLVRGRAVLGDAERVVEVDGRTLTPTAVRHRVASDRVEPREERLALPAVAVDVRERAREDVAGQILGVAGLTDAIEDVAVHRVDVRVVKIRERRAVAAAGPLDDVRHRPHLLEGRKRVDPCCDECHDLMAPYPRPQSVRAPYRQGGGPPTHFGYQNRHSETRFGRGPYEPDPRTGTSGSGRQRASVPMSESKAVQIFCLRISIALSTAVLSSACTS